MSESLEIGPEALVQGACGQYVLGEKVGEGGFGEVWRAQDAHQRNVAIKFARGDVGARSLRAEAELAPRLGASDTTGIVPVIELIEGDSPILVMEWVEGVTLRQALDGLDSPDRRAGVVRAFYRLAGVVADVHRRRIAHGDLKPENVILKTGGEHPMLIDFGLARAMRSTRLETKLSASLGSQSGLEGGTLAYLPPEAVKGAEPSLVGDVYALGVMLHEVLLGRRPDKARELSSLGLPEQVTEVLRRALAFDPADRYPSASELSTALGTVHAALTATGSARRLLVLGRWLKAGLAAFFVTLRYVSVAALLGLYVFIAVSAVTFHPVVLLGYVPFVLLHIAIRWEGPETPEEAALRREGNVLSKKLFAKSGKKR